MAKEIDDQIDGWQLTYIARRAYRQNWIPIGAGRMVWRLPGKSVRTVRCIIPNGDGIGQWIYIFVISYHW